MLKGILSSAFILILLAGCGLDRQAKELRALENCKYEFVAADSVYLAGTDVNKLIAERRMDPSSLPGVALGFLSRNIPLSGVLQVRVTNPTKSQAGIQQFDYKILVEGHEIVDGTSDSPISIPGGETVIVPVKLHANVYTFLSDRQTLGKVLAFVQNVREGQATEKIRLTVKIKPTLALGDKQLNYPGYITIDKEIDGDFLAKQGIRL